MKKENTLRFIITALITIILFSSCTEPYALQTEGFEDVLVVEATITNEYKYQKIKISRTYRFEENGPVFETGAHVSIKDDLGNIYNFSEQTDAYVSTSEFQAQPNRLYRLHIVTEDGKTYTSTNEKLTTATPIQDVEPRVITKDGQRGVELNVKSFDPTNTSKYYRYEYEETYKIIAPKWVPLEAVNVSSNELPSNTINQTYFDLVQRTTEAKTCFSSKKSDKLILTSTNNLSEDRVDFPIRFIKNNDFIISHRYSILAKQYVQSLESYTYYDILKNMSSNESILSQTQPGFFSGNINNINNHNEKIIGFFNVSSYSEKRIFFNYQDLFPSDPLPPYPYKCPFISVLNEHEYNLNLCFTFGGPSPCHGSTIESGLISKSKVWYEGTGTLGNKISLYPIQCGDCTSFSSNIIPSFWID